MVDYIHFIMIAICRAEAEGKKDIIQCCTLLTQGYFLFPSLAVAWSGGQQKAVGKEGKCDLLILSFCLIEKYHCIFRTSVLIICYGIGQVIMVNL